MNGSRELNGHRPLKSSPSPGKKIVTIVAPKEANTDELVSITPNERNWRGICIALLVIVAVLALILFFIVLLSPPYEGPFNPGIKFTIDNVVGTDFQNCPFNGSWISSAELIFRDPAGGVSIFNTESNSVRILINNSTFRMSNGVDFAVSADLKYILITKDVKKIYKYTKKAKYRVQEVTSTNHIPLTPYLAKHNQEPLFIQEVMWSPRGNAIIFTYNNNIFYKREVTSTTEIYQITYTGSDFVYNGVPDWLYQQEITKGRKCMWISPDGKYLAFATFNDTLVGRLKYPVFKTNNQYPEIMSLSYPKVGTVNPEVTISICDLQNPKNGSYVSINKPERLLYNESYFVNLVWNKNEQFAVSWMNREQSLSVISICSKPSNWRCEETHVEDFRGDDQSWVEPSPDIIFSNNGSGFITISSVLEAEGMYPQVCFIDKAGKLTPITHGQIVVTSIRAWDQISGIIYFEAVPEGKPMQRHVYNVSDSLVQPGKWHCLTCPIELSNNRSNSTLTDNSPASILEQFNTTRNRTNKENVTACCAWPVRTDSCRFTRSYFHQFNEPIRHYILECLGPDVPKVLVMRVANNTPSYLLNNNTELAAKYARMAKPQIRLMPVELETGYQAQVKLLLPPMYRERAEREFPFVLYVQGTPGGQGVTDEWKVDWNTYFASSMNFVIGIVDGRGSGGQSDEMKHEIKKRIGTIDVEDQLTVLLNLRESLHFIDRGRTGVWGRGYGGYVTGRLLEQDNGTFQCGVAVAPITSWAHYVSTSAERLMGTANVTDNYRGYEDADLTKRVANFKDKKLLLIHGTADKLVHYQHTMLLVHSFSKQGVLFHHLTYPDEDHDFADSSHHVMKTMENFWTNCFGPIEIEDFDEGLSFLTFAR